MCLIFGELTSENGILCENVVFDFLQGWDGLVYPTSAPSKGSTSLTLSGYGFDKTSEKYTCVFGNMRIFRTPAKALDSTTIICDTFPIGLYLAVNEVAMWLEYSGHPYVDGPNLCHRV